MKRGWINRLAGITGLAAFVAVAFAAVAMGGRPGGDIVLIGTEVFDPPAGSMVSLHDDVVCENGTTASATVFSRFQFHVKKTVTCDSGTFTLLLQATQDPSGGTYGPWSVIAGTGAFDHLRGGGTFVGVGSDTNIVDTYRGWLVNG